MKILIAGAPDKFFHLKEFGEELRKYEIEYTLVNDSDYATGLSKKNINMLLLLVLFTTGLVHAFHYMFWREILMNIN